MNGKAIAALFFYATGGGEAKNMLMGNTLEEYLAGLVSFDSLTVTQMDYILSMSDNTTSLDRSDLFETEESKDDLRTYLYAEVSTSSMEELTAEMIASVLSLGALYPEEQLELEGFAGPAEKDYTGDGNLVRLGNIKTRDTNIDSNIYNGIWGFNKGSREYALLCSTWGLEIIDVTNPATPFRVQGVQMTGGLYWRDVATHTTSSGEMYAYTASQDKDKRPSNLYVFNLANLSDDINSPNGEDSNPIPRGTSGYLDLGQDGFGHTLNVHGGFLFLHSYNLNIGCRVYSLSMPMSPQYLFSHRGNGLMCHDSFVWDDVNVGGELKSLWVVSEGSGMVASIIDFTDVTSDTASEPPLISKTPVVRGTFAHSTAAYEKMRFLFQFDESNSDDIDVYDMSDVSQPRLINTFQYAGESNTNALPHNGWVHGNTLYVAYYEAGLIAFDISNPYHVQEVGKIETFRDPEGDGSFNRQIKGRMEGAWNVYTKLPSGNILVTDMYNGLYIVQANAPYSKPDAPDVSLERNENDDVTLSWNAVPNARAYFVERSIEGESFVVIAEYLTTTSYVDSSVGDKVASYIVKAKNSEGEGIGEPRSVERQITAGPTNGPALSTPSPSNAVTTQPTPPPMPQQPTPAEPPTASTLPTTPLPTFFMTPYPTV